MKSFGFRFKQIVFYKFGSFIYSIILPLLPLFWAVQFLDVPWYLPPSLWPVLHILRKLYITIRRLINTSSLGYHPSWLAGGGQHGCGRKEPGQQWPLLLRGTQRGHAHLVLSLRWESGGQAWVREPETTGNSKLMDNAELKKTKYLAGNRFEPKKIADNVIPKSMCKLK